MKEAEENQDDLKKKFFRRTARMKQLTQPREIKSALLKVFGSEYIRKKCMLTIIPNEDFMDGLVEQIEENLSVRSEVHIEAKKLLKKDDHGTLGSAFQTQLVVLVQAIQEVLSARFRIPVDELDEKLISSLLGAKRDDPETTSIPLSQCKRVLIVDDTKQTRKILAHLLKKNGYLPFEAEDGEDALYRMSKERIDLVLLDVNMPKMNGKDCLKNMKSSPNLKEIPVLMISAFGTPEILKECIGMGAHDFIVKPFTSKTILEKIKKILKN